MSKFKHPNNKYERRLIGKAKLNKRIPRKGATPMEELRTIDVTLSPGHFEDQLAQFFAAIGLVNSDEDIVEIQGLPIPKKDIPIRIKFCKRIKTEQPEQEVT